MEPPRSRADTRAGHDAVGTTVAVHRVLLATDLSTASGRAAVEAIRIAARSDAHLLVFSVIDPGRLRLPGGRFLRRVDQERSRVEDGVQHLVRRARTDGVDATFLVWEGDPAEAIIAAAEAEDADCIVLGSRGRNSLGRILLGSTSSRVAEAATCPVQVVPG
jgi:nucleotide-binding universal stress UspA family protein